MEVPSCMELPSNIKLTITDEKNVTTVMSVTTEVTAIQQIVRVLGLVGLMDGARENERFGKGGGSLEVRLPQPTPPVGESLTATYNWLQPTT